MPPVLYDFADPSQERMFPAHGWANNTQGVKILWLPIIRLLNNAQQIRKSSRIQKPITYADSLSGQAFAETLVRLLRSLSEAQYFRRHMISSSRLAEAQEPLPDSIRAWEMLPLFTDISYVYLRRLADQIARAGQLVLFRKPNQKPTNFGKLRKLILSAKTQDENLLVDRERLIHTFEKHTGWFDTLARTENGHSKGIRDALEHRSARILVGVIKTNDEPAEVQVDLLYENLEPNHFPDLFARLKPLVSEFSAFLTALHECVGHGEKYEWHDSRVLTGLDDDSAGFWPEIPH